MPSPDTDQTIVIETGRTGKVWATAFQADGKHVLGGFDGNFGRWQFADREDAEEVGKQTGMNLNAISVSRDGRWIVCGTEEGASIWDVEMDEKIVDVEGTNYVGAVDVSPDSTKFATGTGNADRPDNKANIWDITTGERLVGPLEHDKNLTGIQFSPNGERVATACYAGSTVRIFDGRNGDELITIGVVTPQMTPATPLVWSNDGKQIFAACHGNTIRSFDVSTGSQRTESQVPSDGDENNFIHSLAMSTNGKFIVTFTDRAISFLDTSTLTCIDPTIEESGRIRSIAISQDSSYLATGRGDGTIVIRDISKILPESSYGPFHVSTHEQVKQGEQASSSPGHEDGSPTDDPTKPSPPHSKTNGKDGDGDPLDAEVPSSTPGPQFDYDESPSTASTHPREDESPPVNTSHAISRSSDAPPMTSPLKTRREGNAESPQSRSIFKKWRQRKGNKDPVSHESERHSNKSRNEPVDRRSPSSSPARVDEGPSWMAAGRRKPRAVATSFGRPKRKSPVKAAVSSHPNKDPPRQSDADSKYTRSTKQPNNSFQPSAVRTEAGPVQQANSPSQPSTGLHVVRGSGKITFSFTFPEWMCCGSGTEDDTHEAK